MAIIHDGNDNGKVNDVKAEIDQNITDRIENLEVSMHQLNLDVETLSMQHISQTHRMDVAMEMINHGYLHENNARETRLIFSDNRIESDKVYRGAVHPCFSNICNDIRHIPGISNSDSKQIYFGATCDPARRLREHIRTNGRKQHLKMQLLYHTTRMEKAADMENKLLHRFPFTYNVRNNGSGLVFGKPSYFVYLLKWGKLLK